jgi:peptidoglycan LD-endopeptidase CwlK
MSSPLFFDDVLFLQRLLKSQGLYSDDLDGDWGPNTDKGVKAFETKSDQIAAHLGTFDKVSERCIHTLNLKAQEVARKCLRTILDAGITARIISGTRTYAEQDALYRKGRFGNPGPVVTKARGGQSNHNFCIAWDIGIFQGGRYLGDSPLYDKAGKVVLAAGISGLEWGGNWKGFKDLPHYQLATGLKIGDLRKKFECGEQYI